MLSIVQLSGDPKLDINDRLLPGAQWGARSAGFPWHRRRVAPTLLSYDGVLLLSPGKGGDEGTKMAEFLCFLSPHPTFSC